jgi:hypothetical protein
MQAQRPDNAGGQDCLGVWKGRAPGVEDDFARTFDDFTCSYIGAFVCGPSNSRRLRICAMMRATPSLRGCLVPDCLQDTPAARKPQATPAPLPPHRCNLQARHLGQQHY